MSFLLGGVACINATARVVAAEITAGTLCNALIANEEEGGDTVETLEFDENASVL